MKLSLEQTKHIAELARLELDGLELEAYSVQLSNILSYIQMLNKVDTSGTQPTAQVTGLENIFRNDDVHVWDEWERDQALHDAPATEGRFIKVRKVFD